MEIPEHIEKAVREAFRGVVARDGDRVKNAFRGLNEDDSKTALGLGLFVCGYIVNDVFRDGPTDDNLHELAQQIVRSESKWIDLGKTDSVAELLRVAARGDTSFGVARPEDVFGMTFVCTGHLLAAFSLENQQWWDYLDQIWAAAESQTRG